MADPLSMAASIAGIISLADALYRHVYKFARAAIGAKEDVQLLANEVNAFSGVLRTLEALANELETSGQAFEPALQVDHLTQCRGLFEKIQARVMKAADNFNSRSRLEGIARQLKWPFSASETRGLLQQLSRCKDSISLATSADTMRNLQLCLMRQEQHGDTLSKISESLKKVEIQTGILVDSRKQLVLDFFMPPDVNPQAKLDQSIKLRQPTTGEWLTHSFGFTEWLQTPGSRLWLNGIPGGGKTVIAGAIIQAAIMRSRAESDVAVAFSFCDYKQKSTLKPVKILGSIASQLAIQRDDTFELLQSYYDELHPARALNRPADPNELVGIITSMCDLLQQVIIVVDGLDECGDGISNVLEMLSDLTSYTTSTSIALLSRNDFEIRQVFGDEFKQIPIEAHTKDLDIYVRAEMERRIRAKRLHLQNLRIRDEIHNELVSRANGIELVTDADRWLALNELPPTLPETYLRLLQRINKRPLRVRKMVQRCLQFIAFFMPMPIEALCQALSTPEVIGAKLDDTNTVSERDIALCCSSLIRKTADGESFEFAHFSVREFLEHESLSQTTELATYRLVKSDGEAQLALQCLRFLQMSNFDEKSLACLLSDSHEAGGGTNLPSFCWYAAIGLLELTTEGFHNALVLDAAKSLFHSPGSSNFLLWIYITLVATVETKFITTAGDPFGKTLQIEEVLNDAEAKIRASVLDRSLLPLHVACILNFPEICSMLLLEGVPVNIECALGTPLLLAEMSLPGVLRKLVGLYPGHNSFTFSYFLSSSFRRNETINCLVSAGASFTYLDKPIGNHSLLYIVAIIGCHLKDFGQVITLLDHGIVPRNDEITAFGDYLETWSGLDDCQKLATPLLKLFNYMMRSSIYDSNWGFKLGEELWRTAISLGFDFTNNPDLTDSRISLAAEAMVEKTFLAFKNDDTATLQLCLKDGRVNILGSFERGGTEGELLHHAVAYDALNCVRLLLELGSDIHRKTKSGATIIHCCDSAGDGSVLKLLVKRGALLLAQDQNSYTLWHLCASSNICNMPFLDALFNIDQELSERALVMKTEVGSTPLTLALTAVEEARDHEVDATENKAIFFLDYCQNLPHFWDKHEDIFPRTTQTASRKVLQHVVDLGFMPDATQPYETTPLHNLGANATHEWTEYLKSMYPGALSLRVENRLPLELYIERVLWAGKPPRSDVLHALAPLHFLGLKDCEGVTVWEFVCQLKHQAQRWENSKYFLKTGYKALKHVDGDLLSTKAMEAYEAETGQCGVLLLLSSSPWIREFSTLISRSTLDRSIRLSTLWDPKDEVAVGFLKRAIQDGNDAKVELLIKHGLNVHQRESGTSPIECACQPEVATELCSSDNGIKILQCLLDHSIPERLREFSADHEAISLLHRLAMESPPERIEWLLKQLVDKGADLNAINPNASSWLRMSPLAWHLRKGSIKCAALLLEMGADPVFTGPGKPGGDDWQFDALTWAVQIGSMWFLEKLHTDSIERRIELNWTPKLHVSADSSNQELRDSNISLFHVLCMEGNIDAVQFYIEQELIEDIDFAIDRGITPLHFSTMVNNIAVMEYLISNGSSIDSQTEYGATALHLAASWGHLESTELLLRLGASNLIDHSEQTARMLAVKHGYGSVIDLLDKQFGDPGSSGDMSSEILASLSQSLGKAIESGNMDECKRLFACGHPLNKPIHARQPAHPLLYAIAMDQIEIAQWLLDNGASVMVNDGDICPPERSTSVLEEAARREAALPLLPNILVRYHQGGGCWYRGYELPLHWASEYNNLEGLRLILEYFIDNAVTIGDRSHLSHNDVVRLVLNRQYLRLEDDDTWAHGATALHIAVKRGHLACAELLLANGADPDGTDIDGESPLDCTSDPEMATLLLQHGASPLPTILLHRFNSLLRLWANNCTALMALYHETYAKSLGVQLGEISDLAAPSFIQEGPYALNFSADHEPISVMAIAGFGSKDVSYGHGYLLNRFIFGHRNLHGFVLNSQINPENLQPLPWHWCEQYEKLPFLNTTFDHFRCRFDDRHLKTWLNLQPDRGWSPLCRAASNGSIRAMENCLHIGAEIDFEGCPLGSALMIASACGKLEAVKLLVRKGAATSYVGRIGPINVISVARSKKVKAWLLVGRFNDRLSLMGGDDARDSHSDNPISYWSGPVQARYNLVTWTARHASESALEYAKRLNWIKRNSFQDGAVSPVDGFIYPQHCSQENSTADPDHETRTPGENTQVDRAKAKASEVCNGDVEGVNDMSAPESDEVHYEEPVLAQGTYDSPGLSGFVVTLRGEIDRAR
ncbi:Ankyrin repeat [Fusarium albosuccineum]|uniref:Ankyrin repeat n=1 Tax=Fusarium albosuccineum TaxID=1237068 RepID=A0A8H4LMN4_9HYPO|nr:Ankyrin repeat [Fusarium albosuccineum]